MSEAKEREDIDCYRSGNSSQNQLKTPLMVKLIELCRLKNGILVISFHEPWDYLEYEEDSCEAEGNEGGLYQR